MVEKSFPLGRPAPPGCCWAMGCWCGGAAAGGGAVAGGEAGGCRGARALMMAKSLPLGRERATAAGAGAVAAVAAGGGAGAAGAGVDSCCSPPPPLSPCCDCAMRRCCINCNDLPPFPGDLL